MRFARSPRLLPALALLVAAAIAPLPAAAGDPAGEASDEVALAFRAERGVPLEATVEDLCCGAPARFEGEPTDELTLGYGNAALWLRLDLASTSGLVQLSPILDDVALYARTSDGAWKVVRTGDQIANGAKLLDSPFMALPLPQDMADKVAYVRILQTTAVTVRATQWALPSFVAMQAADQALKTFLFGFILAMILFNSVVSLLVRDVAFLLNAASISGILTVALYLSGYGAAYFWPGLPGWSNSFFVFGMLLAIVAGGAFMWLFVRAPDERMVRGWPILGGVVSAALAGVLYVVLPYNVVQPWLLASAAAVLIGGGGFIVRRAWNGDARSRILLFPLALAMVPGVAMVALDRILGVRLPAFGNNGLEITLCVEAVMFSLALTSRIRVTERAAREADARLLSLRDESAARAIAAQDAERKRLAADLHDGAGQSFLVVLNGLRRFARSPLPAEHRQTAAQLADATSAALNDLRRISRDMHPSAVEHLGLARALDGLFANAEGDGIEREMAIDFDESTLPPDAKLHVFRIAQECVANTVRHAAASRIRGALAIDGDELVMRIEDDGIGLSGMPDAAGYGLGLTSIAERVRTLDGLWTMTQSELGGLAVTVRVPVAGLAGADG